MSVVYGRCAGGHEPVRAPSGRRVCVWCEALVPDDRLVTGLDAAARAAGDLQTASLAARAALYTAVRDAVEGGMTKVEAARRSGVSRVTVDKILRDRPL